MINKICTKHSGPPLQSTNTLIVIQVLFEFTFESSISYLGTNIYMHDIIFYARKKNYNSFCSQI